MLLMPWTRRRRDRAAVAEAARTSAAETTAARLRLLELAAADRVEVRRD